MDVLEVAFKHELAAWLPLSDCSLASACMTKALTYHAEGKAVALVLSRDADGRLVAQLIDEEADDAPTDMLFLMLRPVQLHRPRGSAHRGCPGESRSMTPGTTKCGAAPARVQAPRDHASAGQHVAIRTLSRRRSRQQLPYVVSVIDAAGTAVLFDRGYRAMWLRRPDGSVERSAPLQWQRSWRSLWLYQEGTGMPEAEKLSRAYAALEAWGVSC